jgi:hypothetical protein
MAKTNTSTGTWYFPLKSGEDAVEGAVYEIVDGKAQAVDDSITGVLIGVCIGGGDKMRPGEIMLDIDPTSIYEEAYESDAPTIGTYADELCKLVVAVDTEKGTFKYLLRVAAGE